MGKPRKREVGASEHVDHGSYHPDGKLRSARRYLRMKSVLGRFRQLQLESFMGHECVYDERQVVGNIIFI
jgi:hypothetical protein